MVIRTRRAVTKPSGTSDDEHSRLRNAIQCRDCRAVLVFLDIPELCRDVVSAPVKAGDSRESTTLRPWTVQGFSKHAWSNVNQYGVIKVYHAAGPEFPIHSGTPACALSLCPRHTSQVWTGVPKGHKVWKGSATTGAYPCLSTQTRFRVRSCLILKCEGLSIMTIEARHGL